MFKFLPGILVIQAITVAFILLLPDKLNTAWAWLQILFPVAAVGFLASFWFDSIATQLNRDKITELQNKFLEEREKIRINAERSKLRLLKQNHQQVIEETRSAHAKANFKVGAISTAAAGIGLILMTTQLIAIGVTILMTAGGVVTGYAMRARQEKTGSLGFRLPFRKDSKLLEGQTVKRIKASPKSKAKTNS